MDDEELTPFQVHVLADLHDIAKQVSEMHAALEEFRPLLKALPTMSAVDKAGLLRSMRKGART